MQQRDRRTNSQAVANADPTTTIPAPGAQAFDLDAFLDTTARAGVDGAASPLPHSQAIQRAFGRHDVGGIAATVGGAGAASSAALGASAYAIGDRVAFAESPDLHLAAHEAAHVVQQRGGVQLQGGIGRSGDRYEQHADRVADLVVRGESAEQALDELAGGSATTAIQRHDSPNHIAIGQSVEGPPVVIHGVTFSSGQIAALTDYIGDIASPAAVEKRFTKPQVLQMLDLLERGVEDVMPWDIATGGAYSKEAQGNEHHFAPAAGDGGANFRDRFIELFSRALFATTPSKVPDLAGAIGGIVGRGQPADDPQALVYSAEHYLQDAFSAGHHIAARDVEKQVEEILNIPGEAGLMGAEVGRRVFDRVGPKITENWGLANPLGAAIPIGRNAFIELAHLGAFKKGSGGMVDAVRRFVHERLAKTELTVTSEAHPEPFQLLGDHGLSTPGAAESVDALQLALYEARELVKRGASVSDPEAEATRLFDRHCPTPVASSQQTIRAALETGTEDKEAVLAAVVDTTCDTITEVMDFVVLGSGGAVERLTPALGTEHEIPTIDKFVPEEGVA